MIINVSKKFPSHLKNCKLIKALKISEHRKVHWSISTLSESHILDAMDGHHFEKAEYKMRTNVTNLRIFEPKLPVQVVEI